ncbi:MAG TPA: hypothetical protein VJY15_01075 [Candidatus Acidoferrum sp.]|nr:hypothetical protein [Candidatus Acidoferrum sp.]
MRTHTEFFSFSRFANAEGASLVARVAMVCNDLAIANSAMGYFKNIESNAVSHIRQGAPLYFVRMSCGHLREGFKVVGEIRNHAALGDLVTKCDARVQSAFMELSECLPMGQHHKEFTQYIKPIRDTIAFHYDLSQVSSALEQRAKRSAGGLCSMTIGEDIHSCRFEFADAILDTIVCRNLWKIPLDADGRTEADRISEWCFQKSVQFLEFGGEFVRRFLKEHAN